MENHSLSHICRLHGPPVPPRPSELPARALRRAFSLALFFLLRAALLASDLGPLGLVAASSVALLPGTPHLGVAAASVACPPEATGAATAASAAAAAVSVAASCSSGT